MTGKARKTLSLPSRPEPAEAPVVTRRRPVRGGAAPRPSANAPTARAPQRTGSAPAKPEMTSRRIVPPQALPIRSTPPQAPTASPPQPSLATALSATSPLVRISKLMAERGMCSRREADAFIERGWVFVDGERVSELGSRADPSATITLAGQARAAQQRLMTFLLHKPVGYVSGQPEPGFTPASSLILPETQCRTPDTPLFHASHLKGLAPAGRLDIDSTGLLVLTQDGRIARQLIGENSTVDKEYLVRVEGRLSAEGLALLNHGLSLDGKALRPAKVEWQNDDQLRFVLREGKKRQIRRMCELVGLKVVGLKRVRIGRIMLGDLPLGQWRFLREDEKF